MLDYLLVLVYYPIILEQNTSYYARARAQTREA